MLAIRVIVCCALLCGCAGAQEIPELYERFSQPPRPDAAAQANEEKLQRAVAQHPDSPDAWTDLGWRLYVNGRYGQCEYAMAQARRYAPADPYVLWLSGVASYAMHHYADAHKFLWQLFRDNKT